LCTSIVKEIERSGPMPFDRYMEHVLYRPGLGYYVNGLHKFGAAGDFITAPEQGTLFARTLARQLDQVALQLPADWTLLEIGAGSGALARDLLPAMIRPPAAYRIVDRSAMLREQQAATLSTLPERVRQTIDWLDRPPRRPFDGVVVANEVLDALPVARFERANATTWELAVAVESGRLGWTRRPAAERLRQAVERISNTLPEVRHNPYRSELCLDLPAWLDTVTRPLRRGLVLLFDYGYPRAEYYHPARSDGTLVCHYRHRAHFDPFVWPGLTDLSAFVDFTAVAEAGDALGLSVAGFTTQAGFLLSLGAHELIEHERGEQRRLTEIAELKRLTLPGEMGEKFKVLGLTRQLAGALGGFRLIDHLHRL